MAPPVKPLKAYRDRMGLSREDVAELLTDRLGRRITPGGIQRYENYSYVPKPWAAALGIDPGVQQAKPGPAREYELPDLGEGQSPDSVGGRQDDPPMMPPGGRQVAPTPQPAGPGGDFSLVRDRISKAYNAIGAGVSMATRNDGYAKVTETYSPDLAKAWTDAAKENANVAKIVAFMESGGPVGELVVCHVILVLGFVYVSGRAPALATIYGGKFDAYHHAAARNRIADIEAGLTGEFDAGRNGAAGPVGDARAVA